MFTSHHEHLAMHHERMRDMAHHGNADRAGSRFTRIVRLWWSDYLEKRGEAMLRRAGRIRQMA